MTRSVLQEMAKVLLGHSDPRRTSEIYNHFDLHDLRGAVAKLG